MAQATVQQKPLPQLNPKSFKEYKSSEERALIDSGYFTRKEASDPSFYKPGRKGYYFALLDQLKNEPPYRNLYSTPPKELVEKFGIEQIAALAMIQPAAARILFNSNELCGIAMKYGLKPFMSIASSAGWKAELVFECIAGLTGFIKSREGLMQIASEVMPTIDSQSRFIIERLIEGQTQGGRKPKMPENLKKQLVAEIMRLNPYKDQDELARIMRSYSRYLTEEFAKQVFSQLSSFERMHIFYYGYIKEDLGEMGYKPILQLMASRPGVFFMRKDGGEPSNLTSLADGMFPEKPIAGIIELSRNLGENVDQDMIGSVRYNLSELATAYRYDWPNEYAPDHVLPSQIVLEISRFAREDTIRAIRALTGLVPETSGFPNAGNEPYYRHDKDFLEIQKFLYHPEGRSKEETAQAGRFYKSLVALSRLAESSKNKEYLIDALGVYLNTRRAEGKAPDVIACFPQFVSDLESGRILPNSLLRLSRKGLEENGRLYEQALALARMGGSRMEQAFLNSLDVSGIAAEIKDKYAASEVLVFLESLDPGLSRKIAAGVVKREWLSFSEETIDQTNLYDLECSINLAVLLYKIDPENKAYANAISNLKKSIASADITAVPPQTMADFREILGFAASLENLDPALRSKFLQVTMEGVDMIGIARSESPRGRIEPEMMEEIRLGLNRISKTSGDEFVLSIGMAVAQEPVNERNFFRKLDEVERCFFSNPSQYDDVNSLYRLVGRFQASALAKFLIDNRKSFTDKEFQATVKRLEELGLDVPVTASSTSKVIRSARQGQFGYIVKKGWGKLSTESFRNEYNQGEIGYHLDAAMASGFSSQHAVLGGEHIATIIKGYPGKGGRIGYESDVGEGVNVSAMTNRLGSSLTAVAVGAYTTGERKMADFAVQDGKIENYLVSDRDGLVVMYPDGSIQIKRINDLKKSDINTPGFEMNSQPMDIMSNLKDFQVFTQKMKTSRASAFQGHLLLYNGEVQLSENSSPVRDKRRCLAVMKDGSFAVIDFSEPITLLEAAVLGARMGAVSMVNLDTGMYDYSAYYDSNRKMHKLGTFDAERPTNVVIFYTAPPPGTIKKKE